MSILDKQDNVKYNGTTEEVVVRRKVKKINGQFSAISPLTNYKMKRKIMRPDVFDLLDKVSKPAFSVFTNMKYNREEVNNLTKYVPPAPMNKTQKETHSRKVAELKAIGLIRNVKGPIQERGSIKALSVPKGTYIIDPDMIKCLDHDEAAYLWGQCAEGVDNGCTIVSEKSE